MSTNDLIVHKNAKINGESTKEMIDNGRTKSLVNKDFCSRLKIRAKPSYTHYLTRFNNLVDFEIQNFRTTVYNALPNGHAERFNTTICECLRKLGADH